MYEDLKLQSTTSHNPPEAYVILYFKNLNPKMITEVALLEVF